ncbi:uncharacterized protein LOC133128839 [Conger conger]|uniref:uncharacterized protein LOC133128839 n=1 Tax=Conger conger TaxID=82655 RepID=UPI002A5994F7|nr:uncharacterized protein LOC133128839 [Conger conger]
MEATPPGEERRRRRLAAPTLAEMQEVEAEEGSRGMMEAAITELARSQRALQEAVVELCRLSPRDGSRRTPREALIKMTADDDVEAYLQVFERAAQREEWPQAAWAAILAPFLTGEAQQAYRDMDMADATDYLKLRRAILAQYGFSLPARAQRYHEWAYDASQPARSQIAALTRLTKSWLAEGEGPPLLERWASSKTIRSLRRCSNLNAPKPRAAQLGAQHRKRPPARPDPNRRGRPDAGRPRPEWRCYNCGEEGHLARNCPGREVSRPTARGPSRPAHPCLYLTTCWAHQSTEAPRFPIRVGGQDTVAVLDSGSAITLAYWEEGPRPLRETRPRRPRRAARQNPLPVWAATSGDSEGEALPPERKRQPSTPATSGTITASEKELGEALPPERVVRLAFSEGPQEVSEEAEAPTRFGTAQLHEPKFAQAWRDARDINGVPQGPVSTPSYPYFRVKQDLLYRVCNPQGEEVEQLLVPQPFVPRVLYLGHTHLLGAHLGMEKTYERILARFYWPGVKKAVEDYCRHCAVCQLHSPKVTLRNPLIPLPIIDVPFRRIAMDMVGPLPKSSRGHRYILVILDYATRYPEAVPLRTATGKAVARELFLLFSRVGIAEELLTDQGSCFMSGVLKEMCRLLKVTQLRTSVYHPQTDGLVERFNQTLKAMLRKMIETDGKDWDQLLPYLLFSVREVPQSTTGFAPFELLYGRRPRGLLDLAKEAWEQQPSRTRSLIEHVEQMDRRMAQIWPMMRAHMERAQREKARLYNRGAQVREFAPGDKVMILVPTSECKFLAQWHGPYEVVERTGPVNYRVRQPGRRHRLQIYHVNLMKRWHEPPPAPTPVLSAQWVPPPTPDVSIGEQLSSRQQQALRELVNRSRDIFSTMPGRTHLIAHDISTEPGKTVKLRPYRIPEARRHAIQEEVKKMLDLGVIEESRSAWSSPVVLVPKPDGTWRFCNDFRRLNDISLCDAYPMPRVDELIERLGPARFISTLDLTRGYWQVPLTPRAREKTAFATPTGLYQYTVLPFGVHGAPATFQRLMDQVLRPHQRYAAAYLDDIVIHSTDWDSHVDKVEAVLRSLREAGLTANPAKCRLGFKEAAYLGHTVGRGRVKPQSNKVDSIATWPQPATKKQVRMFLGLVGYYRQFIPEFAARAAPLHDLTKKEQPNRVQWNPLAAAAFQDLRAALGEKPVLITPNFQKPFVLQTDASEVGLGAVLSQIQDGVEHPVTYISRKLLGHERNYATVEKECLAIRWAVGKLRYYLLDREFLLVTDHAPLKWMYLNRDSNARVTRWFLELQPYRFKVEHRAGKLHQNADALSRREDGLGADAPAQGLELRGGVCGTPAPECCATWVENPGGARAGQPRRRHALGEVCEGVYLPRDVMGRSAPWREIPLPAVQDPGQRT